MQSIGESNDFVMALAEQRPRLVRLCAWFTGYPEAAEDLAQETLMAAWKNRERLSGPEKLKPWTSAIARNVCLNWSRQHYREQAHLVSPTVSKESAPEFGAPNFGASDSGGPEGALENELQDPDSLELELDRHELARLLDQALALLPADTAEMLVDHYIQQSSHAEIAAKMGLNTGAVAVRLQRGKLTLQRYLRTSLQAESLAFGLVHPDSLGWEDTNIWCPVCGLVRLQGRYEKKEPAGIFALRCPHCDRDSNSIMTSIDLTKPYHAGILGNTRMYKPAYSRLNAAVASFCYQALATNTATCLACGKPARVEITHTRKAAASLDADSTEPSTILVYCPACEWGWNIHLRGLVLALPDVQRFWRENPRIRTSTTEEIEAQGSLALVTRLQSLSGAAHIDVVTTRETFQFLGVHTNVRL